jgi:hypothetical protein
VDENGAEVVAEACRADLIIQGLWQPQEWNFIVSESSTLMLPQCGQAGYNVLKLAEEVKIRKYNDFCTATGVSFTPDGVLAPHAWKLVQTLASRLTEMELPLQCVTWGSHQL